MNRSRRSNARLRLMTIFGFLAITVVGVATSSFVSLKLIANEQRILQVAFKNSQDALSIRANENRARGKLFQIMLLTEQSAIDEHYREIQEGDSNTKATINRMYERNSEDVKLVGLLDTLNEEFSALSEVRDSRIIPALRVGDKQLALSIAIGEQADRILNIRNASTELADLAQSRVEQATQSSQSLISRSTIIFLIITVIAVAVGVVGFFFLDKALQRVTRGLKQSVNTLGSSSNEMSASSSQVAASVAEMASAVSETTTTVEEVRQTANMANERAKAVSNRSRQAEESATRGADGVEKMRVEIQRIEEKMASVGNSISDLSERSQSIGSIITTVDNIAEQSNLLAVNASIEAAKAGEHGRGFAVVAQEVRNLAEQSREATRQVRQILNEIQRGVGKVGMETEQGSRAVQVGIACSKDATDAIASLLTHVSESAQAAIQIAASSQQQLAGMDQIVEAVQNINESGEQNIEAMRQVEELARELSNLGDNLNKLLDDYGI